MWWVETKEGIAPGQWGKGGIWLQKARGWGCRDGRAVISFGLRPRKRDTSLPPHSSGSGAARCRIEAVTSLSNLRRMVDELW